MKTLHIKTSEEAFVRAMEIAPLSAERLEQSVNSFRVNLEDVHGTTLSESEEVVDFVFEKVYNDMVVNGVFVADFNVNKFKYINSCIKKARKAHPACILTSRGRYSLEIMIGAMYFVAKQRNDFLERDIELKDLISLE